MQIADRGDARLLFRLAVRQLLPVALGVVALAIVADRLTALDGPAVLGALLGIEGHRWTLALLASSISLAAAARYDLVIHRWTGTGVRAEAATRAGFAAIALSQLLGFGLLTGTLVRARCLPGFSIGQAMRLSVTVGVSFVLCWALLAALFHARLMSPAWGLAVLTGSLFLFAVLVWRPVGWLPPVGIAVRLLGLVAADLIAACAAFSLLFPGYGPSLLVALPGFALALGAGALSALPGGIGSFDTIIAGAIDAAGTDLLTALVAFRLVYVVCPALLALAVVIARPTGQIFEVTVVHAQRADASVARLAYRAETQLCETHLLAGRTPLIGLSVTGQAAVALFDRISPGLPPSLVRRALARHASNQGLLPVFYKCEARQAAEARRAGWSVRRVAWEAVLDPRDFDLSAEGRGGLRRKLRKADAAGVSVRRGTADLPTAQMQAIATGWAEARGGARGFSMGGFDGASLAERPVFLAWADGTLIGFVSFWAGPAEWVLDLVRIAPDAPQGTAQALVTAAIQAARADGVRRLSLAGVPDPAPCPGIVSWLMQRRCDGAGLYRFKSAFRPRWEPRYAAAPGPVALFIAGIEIARAIRERPGRS